jgi:GNAT superfamily N-acetyltransferase
MFVFMELKAQLEVRRARLGELDAAYGIVEEYYDAARVIARDSREEFSQLYFREGAGFWIATQSGELVGCIALRTLPAYGNSGEVKRLYVRPKQRGQGIADALHQAMESYAAGFGYQWLYLDTTYAMTAAIRFYEGRGYVRCERYNDNPQATVFMRKCLRPVT